MKELTESIHDRYLLSELVPSLPFNVEQRLRDGGMQCLDCGGGHHIALLGSCLFVGQTIIQLTHFRSLTSRALIHQSLPLQQELRGGEFPLKRQ